MVSKVTYSTSHAIELVEDVLYEDGIFESKICMPIFRTLRVGHRVYIIGSTGVPLHIHEFVVNARQLDFVAQLARTLHREGRAADSIPDRGPSYMVALTAIAPAW